MPREVPFPAKGSFVIATKSLADEVELSKLKGKKIHQVKSIWKPEK